MEDCIFCQIIANNIPSATIYEDEFVKAFLDITQSTLGHTLVVPKKHVANIFEYDSNLAAEVFSRIPKISRAIRDYNPDIKGLNIVSNNGKVADQSVFHSHIHLIPRYSRNKDGFSLKFKDNSKKYTPSDLQNIAQNIASHLK